MNSHSDTPVLDAALFYAMEMGWPVLPLRPRSRIPATEHGFKDASLDETTIRKWYVALPHCNVGIATGRESGILVLDVDPAHGGDESLATLVGTEPEPATITVHSGGGGRHLYFSLPEGEILSRVGIRPGLDIRSSGGYIVAPPSVHASGVNYEFEPNRSPAEIGLSSVPDWLLDTLAETHPHPAGGSLPVRTATGKVGQGRRNDHLTRVAGTLRRIGTSRDGILAALRQENSSICDPPLPDTEVQRVAKSVSRYDPAVVIRRPLTDSGNGERLVDAFGERIRYVALWKKWLVFDGVRWRPDETEELSRMALEVSRSMYKQAALLDDADDRADLAKHASRTESAYKQRAMIECARSKATIRHDDLDSDPMLLNVLNGTIDLRSDEFRPADPSDYITKVANVSYGPGAKCPTFVQFLNSIFSGDEDLMCFVQKALGYSLTGSTQEQCIFVCYGTGSNGKSTLLRAVGDLLGDYATTTPVEALMQQRGSSISNDIARLRGIRFTTALEIEEGRRIAEPLLKALTGGDTVSARFLYSETFDFVPELKLWFGTNHKPRVQGTDHGIWRRMRLIPFDVQIADSDQDKHLSEKLTSERSGILNWLLEGCRFWREADSLVQPEAVLRATAEYRLEMDIIGEFVSDCIQREDGAVTPTAEIYATYKLWAVHAGEKERSQKWLALRLAEHGLKKRKTTGGRRVWADVVVKSGACE
jgi:putative DNA primase/helicase